MKKMFSILRAIFGGEPKLTQYERDRLRACLWVSIW